MSKRNSLGNTLLNYFSKSPKSVPSTPKTVKHVSPEKSKRQRKNSSSDEDIEPQPTRKHRRVLNESDSDIENGGNDVCIKPPDKKSFLQNYSCEKRSGSDAQNGSSPFQSLKNENKILSSPKIETNPNVLEESCWTHDKLEFLKPNNIRDIKKRKLGDPNYDPTTLYVPDDFKNKQTPAMRQWWEIKSHHLDSVLFFKVGKFYELYHMDAVVGVNELGFSYMKGEFAHSGFPESAYARMSTNLVEKGYKVARVEQTETPEMMAERVKRGSSKFEKVVKREVCQITNKGTVICTAQTGQPCKPQAAYMLAIVEKNQGKYSEYGVCFVETSIGEFNLGQFIDDDQCSRLSTLLAFYPPVLVLFECGVVTERTRKIFSSVLSDTLKESLAPDSQVWPANKCLQILAENYYKKNGEIMWPKDFKQFLSDADRVSFAPAQKYGHALKALGASICYLKNCYLDQQVLSKAKFKNYSPPDLEATQLQLNSQTPSIFKSDHMILDAVTLYNLKVFGSKDCLLEKIDYCCTSFGKRLLRQMICAPSCNLSKIKERQEAVEYFLDNPMILQEVRKKLSLLPDLERNLAQIHTNGNAEYNKSHPDSRAIFYEEKTYVKSKIKDFIATLNAFEMISQLQELLPDTSSKLLKQIIYNNPRGGLPDVQEELNFFKNSFDHEQAEKEGIVVPVQGVDQDYDNAIDAITEVENDLAVYLQQQERYFGCKVSYFGNDNKRYSLEVPAHACHKANRDYSLEGQKKGAKAAKRYTTTETKALLKRMMNAEGRKKAVLKDLARRMFEKFSDHYDKWNTIVHCISILDIIISFAEYSRIQSCHMVMPKFIEPDYETKPFLRFIESRHPCIDGEDFIPNTVFLNTNDWSSLALITGPNMGGKSTLMRQVGLLTILSQMGSRIPAEAAELVLVDRIFTRLGADDNILAGQSTFLVELSETSSILHHATKHSLVLLDELGRGTSTYDGTAIAAGVVDRLEKLGCRTLFSTHHHSLVEDFQNHSGVSLGHMACMVESDEQDNQVQQETVAFLYKYITGPCPKSYGFNAARLAGISKNITSTAYKHSTSMESMANRKKVFLKLCLSLSNNDVSNLREILCAMNV